MTAAEKPSLIKAEGTAGAGSLILEFGVLSRLTADPKYEEAAQRAFLAIWNRRSDHDLLGNTIGALHGQWLSPGMSGVPAGMDSYFEYALKAYILLGQWGATHSDRELTICQETTCTLTYLPMPTRRYRPTSGLKTASLFVFSYTALTR